MKLFKYFCQKLKANSIVKKNVLSRPKYNDRNVLENIIFPYILSHFNPKKILDIGREDYQGFYNEFFVSQELWTLDIDPERKEFGAPNHITDDVANVGEHFEKNYFDFILINGVLGWGLDKADLVEKAMNSIYEILNKNGILVIGWNDFDDQKNINPKDIEALKKLKPYYFKPLKGDIFKCINGEHTYNFYIKK